MTMLFAGSWKLRHDEPLGVPDLPCRMHPLPPDIDTGGRSVVVEVDRIDWLPGVLEAGNLPLALAELDPSGWQLTHLLLRIEPHAFQLIRPPRQTPAPQAFDAGTSCRQLQAWLQQAFADNRLYVNNFECFYTTEPEVQSTLAALDLRTAPRPEQHAAAWLLAPTMLSAGFRPAFADEWRIEHHAVRCAALLGGDSDAVAVLALDDKRKAAWDSGHGRVIVRCRRSGQWSVLERSFTGDAQALVAARCGATAFREAPPATVLAVEVRCEARNSGRIYSVRFEWWATADALSAGFAGYRVVVGYLKTLGQTQSNAANGSDLAEELRRLTRAVETWADESGLSPTSVSGVPLDIHLQATVCWRNLP